MNRMRSDNDEPAAPPAPAGLGEIALAKWAELAPLVPDPTPATLGLLEVYCASYDRWRRAQAWLDSHGDVLEIVSDKGIVLKAMPAPKLDVAARAEKSMAEAMAALQRKGLRDL